MFCCCQCSVVCKFAINWTALLRRRTVLQNQAGYMTDNTRWHHTWEGVRQMKYGILYKIQIGIQHMNDRRQENWRIQHHLKTLTSHSFKQPNFHECYWGYIPHLFVKVVVQSIVWCTSICCFSPHHVMHDQHLLKQTQVSHISLRSC